MRRTVAVLVLATALAAADLRAGCLAPADVLADRGDGTGPLWANDAGAVLYAREGTGGRTELVRRTPAGGAEPLARAGDVNDFYVGQQRERWAEFHGGTIEADGDAAFVASTTAPDDPGTPANEAVARRGVYVLRGNTLHRAARFGEDSPLRDAFQIPVPWGSLFDAAAADRGTSGVLRVVFSGQLAGQADRRLGLFRWSETAPAAPEPLVLTGDAAPSGGTYVSLGRLRVNGPGDVAFFGVTRLGESDPLTPGLFLRTSSGASLRLVKFGSAGDDAPGGGRFAMLGDFDLDDAGRVLFAATLDGASRATGLFRARLTAAPLPTFVVEPVLREGDASPLGGSFGSFATAAVRCEAGGGSALAVPLSEDAGGGDGIASLPADAGPAVPLVAVDRILSLAALGGGRAAYQSPEGLHLVLPPDGTEEGWTAFRVTRLDLRNATAGRGDSIRFEGRFLLPPWDAAPPATFRGDAVRRTPAGELTGAALTRIAQVKVVVSSGPGNTFEFGIAGPDAAPTGSLRYFGLPQTLKKLAVAPDGASATWWFDRLEGPGIYFLGPGRFTVDLAAGTFSLTLSRADVAGSYAPESFRAALYLRSADDVAQATAEADSWFAADVRLGAKQPSFGSGRRVVSDGSVADGGILFVDSLRVTRAGTAAAATDSVRLAGTIRLRPGSTPPASPSLEATLDLGGLRLDAVQLDRVGTRGSSYRYRAGKTDLRVDLAKGTFALRASGVPALAGLVGPDETPANAPDVAVGGMELAFSLSIPRVWEASRDLAVTRLAGGRVFTR